MKYKIGDKVKLKSKEGLDELERQVGDLYVHPDAYKNAGSKQTILECKEGFYRYDASSMFWHESLFEGLVEEENPFDDNIPLPDSFCQRMAEEIANSDLFKKEPLDIPTMTTDFVKEHGFPCPDGYQFVDENGNVINATKIFLEKKKKEYPKSYKECCDVLGLNTMDNDAQGYKWELIIRLQELLIARDAYWKIAGEEMGLGKPWEPSKSDTIFGISRIGDIIERFDDVLGKSHILEFPTKEMRDAFYENFKEEIESCKELL